ncbi:MAG TPA: hypothetical protein V6D17_10510 [Candidatus Obscuribacterales bacterium]
MQARQKNAFICAACFSLIASCAPSAAQKEPNFFPSQSQYVDKQTGRALVSPNTRQLTNPASGQSTFNGFNRQLTDPVSGRSTFNGYSIKLTDPITGASTFKGYGQSPLMQNRESAPDFKWNSNVDARGRSQYSGFGRDPLTTSDGRSTFIGNNRKLTDDSGNSTFVGNNRSLADPQGRQEFLKQAPNVRRGTGVQIGQPRPLPTVSDAVTEREKQSATSHPAVSGTAVDGRSSPAQSQSSGSSSAYDTSGLDTQTKEQPSTPKESGSGF